MTNDLTDFPDAKFPPLNNSVDNFIMRYNHSKGGFDLVSSDGIVIKETETPIPPTYLKVLESELKLEDITEIGDIDAGKFSDY